MRNEMEALAVSPRLYKELKDLQYTNEEKDKEIERLNKELEFEKLKNKEVREYIEEHTENVELNIYGMPPVIRSFRGNTQTLLEILDKVDKEK